MIPETFFVGADVDDCVELFTMKKEAATNGVWFQKDPDLDGDGRGVTVHTFDDLVSHWQMAGTAESVLQKCTALTNNESVARIFIQHEVKPLLLSGRRKFDMRYMFACRLNLQWKLHPIYVPPTTRFVRPRLPKCGGTAVTGGVDCVACLHVANVLWQDVCCDYRPSPVRGLAPRGVPSLC